MNPAPTNHSARPNESTERPIEQALRSSENRDEEEIGEVIVEAPASEEETNKDRSVGTGDRVDGGAAGGKEEMSSVRKGTGSWSPVGSSLCSAKEEQQLVRMPGATAKKVAWADIVDDNDESEVLHSGWQWSHEPTTSRGGVSDVGQADAGRQTSTVPHGDTDCAVRAH